MTDQSVVVVEEHLKYAKLKGKEFKLANDIEMDIQEFFQHDGHTSGSEEVLLTGNFRSGDKNSCAAQS